MQSYKFSNQFWMSSVYAQLSYPRLDHVNSDFVFAAYDISIVTTHKHQSASKPISLFPTSFSIPCTQQLWLVLHQLTNSVQQRSVVNIVDIQQAEWKGDSSFPLTLILNSGANLNFFGNEDLLQQKKNTFLHLPNASVGRQACFTVKRLDGLHLI